jgi:hypothetical protein
MAQGIFNSAALLATTHNEACEFQRDHFNCERIPIGDGLLIHGDKLKEPKKYAPAYLAAAIYSYSRNHMWRAILRHVPKGVLNMETDSVYLNLDYEQSRELFTKHLNTRFADPADRYGKFCLGDEPGEFKDEFDSIETWRLHPLIANSLGCTYGLKTKDKMRCTKLIMTGKKSYACVGDNGELLKTRFKGARTKPIKKKKVVDPTLVVDGKPAVPELEPEYYDRVLPPDTDLAAFEALSIYEKYDKYYRKGNPITAETYERLAKGGDVLLLCNSLGKNVKDITSGISLKNVFRVKHLNSTHADCMAVDPTKPYTQDELFIAFRQKIALANKITDVDPVLRDIPAWERDMAKAIRRGLKRGNPLLKGRQPGG